MKWTSSGWMDTSLEWFRTSSRIVDFRHPEDRERLIELRVKQQPDVDWSIDWDEVQHYDDKRLGLEVNRNDAFVANKVNLVSSQEMDEIAFGEAREWAFLWTTYRVKAVLRSGKQLPPALLAKIGSRAKWTAVEGLISGAGELPGLDGTMMEAINEVRNEGYQDALDEILSGDVEEDVRSSRYKRQNRALDLVCNILRAWEAQDQANRRGSRSKDEI